MSKPNPNPSPNPSQAAAAGESAPSPRVNFSGRPHDDGMPLVAVGELREQVLRFLPRHEQVRARIRVRVRVWVRDRVWG